MTTSSARATVVVLPISPRHVDYADRISMTIVRDLAGRGIRTYLDPRNLKLGRRLQEGQRVAGAVYALVVGDLEEQDGTVVVAWCKATGKSLGTMTIAAFIDRMSGKVAVERVPATRGPTDTVLDLATPLVALRAAADLSIAQMADAQRVEASRVTYDEAAADRVSIVKLVAAAEAVGFEVEIRVRPIRVDCGYSAVREEEST